MLTYTNTTIPAIPYCAFAFLIFVITAVAVAAGVIAAGAGVFISGRADAFFATRAPFIHVGTGAFFIISAGVVRAAAAGSASGAAVNISPGIAGIGIAFYFVFYSAAAGTTAVFDISGRDIAGGIIISGAFLTTFFIFASA